MLTGGVNVTEAWVFPRVAVPMAGGLGTVAGMTPFDDADEALVPMVLVAVVVQV